MKKTLLCFMLVFAMVLMTACGSTDNTARESTMAPTTSGATGGPSTGPTSGMDGTNGMNGTESTGVIDGIGDDLKKGAEDVKDGVEDALDMTSASGESSMAH